MGEIGSAIHQILIIYIFLGVHDDSLRNFQDRYLGVGFDFCFRVDKCDVRTGKKLINSNMS
jgi:hypothetical protein